VSTSKKNPADLPQIRTTTSPIGVLAYLVQFVLERNLDRPARFHVECQRAKLTIASVLFAGNVVQTF